MSLEVSQKFNQLVKRVEFFPFEWSANVLAVCFSDSVKIYTFTESSVASKKEELIDSGFGKKDAQLGQTTQGKLNLISSIVFEQKIEHFSWNPKTFISTLKPSINFAVSDNSQNLIVCSANLIESAKFDIDSGNSNIKTLKEKFDVDCIYDISFDHQNGEFVALNADNYCFLWDLTEAKLKARFVLQSPGINICWSRDEKTKFMVGEKSGTIRIFSTETLKPVYSLLCLNENLKTMSFPLLNFDWSQINPEAIVAISNGEIFLWNTSKSCLPEKTIENYEQLKCIKFCQFKENLVGFLDGHDACSKLTVLNYRTNQTIYQSKSLKLLSSFSFNSILPLVAIANEQQITITKING